MTALRLERKGAALSWADAFGNAPAILTGMGPVDRPPTGAAKVFASLCAPFSGVLFPPFSHRFKHRLHLDLGGRAL